MTLPSISIIVPVYNAGKYFTTLLDSILAQTFTQFELILVLDCPTDGSDTVAKRYAQKDNRIVIVENPANLNIGCSRNKGLQMAKGDYIAFADHDDYVYPTWLEELYTTALSTRADVVVCDIENRAEKGSSFYRFPSMEPALLQQGMLQAMLCSKHSAPNTQSCHNANSIWNQLYKASLLRNHAILFPDNRYLSYEDALFNIHVFLCAHQVVAVPQALYVHITHSANAFGSYTYKCEAKLTAYLQALHQLAATYGLPATCLGESVLRKYYVCVFNECKFKGVFATCKLLWQLRKHAFKASVREYKKTNPTLSVAKKIFLTWLT